MRIDQIIIGLLIFSAIFVTSSLLIVDVTKVYNTELDMSLLNTSDKNNDTAFNMVEEIENITESGKDRMIGDNGSAIGENTAEDNLFTNAYRVLKLVGGMFGLMSRLINQIALSLHVPPFLVAAIYLIFVVSVIFTIVYLIFRFKG